MEPKEKQFEKMPPLEQALRVAYREIPKIVAEEIKVLEEEKENIEDEKTVGEIDKKIAVLRKEKAEITGVIYPKKEDLEYQGESIEESFLEAAHIIPDRNMRELAMKAFPGYIKAPIIKDKIIDDNIRDALEQKLAQEGKWELYEFYQSNKLRTSNIRNILQLFDKLFEMGYMESARLKNQSEKIWDDVEERGGTERFKKYHHTSEEEKLKVVDKVSDFSKQICIYFISDVEREK